jgi:hypothetical protein
MLRHWLAIVVAIALLPSISFAQGTEEVDPDKAAGSPEIDETVDTTDSNPAPAEFTTLNADQLAYLLQRERLFSQALIASNNKVAELEKKLEDMEVLQAKVDALEAQLVDVENNSDRALGRMAEDPVFRTEMGRAMQGRLDLQNFLGMPKIIYINGTAWTVRTGESYIYVPVGKVTIQESRHADPTFIDMEEWNTDAGQMVMTYKLVP